MLIALIPISYLHLIKDGYKAGQALRKSETTFFPRDQTLSLSLVLEPVDIHNGLGWLMSTHIQGKERVAARRN